MSSTLHRLPVDSGHDPRGPDGQGWNRMAIHGMTPVDRCALRPRSRAAALDKLRGMARWGVATEYDPCIGRDCVSCARAARPRQAWSADWQVHEGPGEGVSILHGGAVVAKLAGWRDLVKAFDAPQLRRAGSPQAWFWVAA